jgi:uncharacterized phiE125 gp8 family phage protein
MYALRVVTPPTAEPLSLAEARAHLRVDSFADDAMLAGYILAARQHIESICGLALCTTTYAMTLDDFPVWADALRLPRGPVQSVSAVRYYDATGALVSWSSSDWETDLRSEPARVRPRDGFTWPDPADKLGAVEIEFIAGYGGPELVPQPIMQAMRLLVGHFYENREAVNVGNMVTELPLAVDVLLGPYRPLL